MGVGIGRLQRVGGDVAPGPDAGSRRPRQIHRQVRCGHAHEVEAEGREAPARLLLGEDRGGGDERVEPLARLGPPHEEQADRSLRLGIRGRAGACREFGRQAEADHGARLPAGEAVGARDHRAVLGGVGDQAGAAPGLQALQGVRAPTVEAVAQGGRRLARQAGRVEQRVTRGGSRRPVRRTPGAYQFDASTRSKGVRAWAARTARRKAKGAAR